MNYKIRGRKYLIGIDIGTTNTKTILTDFSGNLIAKSSQSHNLLIPKKNWVEQNPIDWWEGVKNTVKEAVSKAEIKNNEVVGISVSSQSSTVLAVDNNGEILGNAIIWLDNRAEDIRDQLNKKLRNYIKNINPNYIQNYQVISKYIWFKNNKTLEFDKCHKFLQCNGYINYKLTGNFSTDISSAGLIHLYNFQTKNWDEGLCRQTGIPIDKLPKLFKSSDIIGNLSKEAAYDLGLDTGVYVAAGGIDTSLTALASGIISDDEVLFSLSK